jgi:MarR family transcriptional regulator, lower aerobic nicotinate degradation pathway regulator
MSMAIQPQPVVGGEATRSTVLITRLARAMRRRFEEAVAPLGLRARHLVALTHLKDHGPSAQQRLIEVLGLDASNLVALLNELEDANLIVRSRDRADRRRGIIELSAEGERVLADVDRALEAVDEEILSALSGEERATLNDLLMRAGASAPLAPACEVAEAECEEAEEAECEAVEAALDPPASS